VLVPKLFGPLEEFKIVLHATFYQLLDGNGAINLVAFEEIWTG
jgi:hypothetical protein